MYGNDSLYTLVLLRHGESEWKSKNLYTGVIIIKKKAKLVDGKYRNLIIIQLRDKQQSDFPRDSQTLDRALAARLRKFASSVTLPETDLLATSHSGVHTHE